MILIENYLKFANFTTSLKFVKIRPPTKTIC